MTVTTAFEALQTQSLTIVGVESAPTAYPGSLNTADMPIVIAWPAEGDNHQAAMSFSGSWRDWRLAFYCKPAEQGLGIAEGWAEAMVLLQSAIDFWMDSDNCKIVTGTYQVAVQQSKANPIADTGLTLIAYPPPATGQEGWPHYFGFELRLKTKETWAQT